MASGGGGGEGFEFCSVHLVQNCRLCRNVSTVEELRAVLRDTIVSYRQTNIAALDAAANYENLPEMSGESRDSGDTEAASSMEQRAIADGDNTRPRSLVTVRRSHTSPDTLMNRRIVRPVTIPSSPNTSAVTAASLEGNGDVGGAAARGAASVRKGLDSFLRATKKKLTNRSRRANSASPDEQLQRVTPSMELAVSPARVPLIAPVTNPLGPPETPNTRTRDSAGRQMRAHTTVDYRHHLVPGLTKVTNCGFYWGVMDRYKAESLLENQPEGAFLLRDSSQDDFIFSVSFRRYGRSLHARVEQWNHKFSFDAHDSGVFKADSVTALLEHYKDPQTCMFFEPMLTRPLNRPQPFSLLHLARAVVCDCISYDAIDTMWLPKDLQQYLKYYHYKQQIRVRTDTSWIVLTPNPSF